MTSVADTDILYLNVAGTPFVVLDTSEAATELLEKRSSIYSGRSLLFLIVLITGIHQGSRARMPMMNELMGWSFHLCFMPYGV
jgi:hypothetical protein